MGKYKVTLWDLDQTLLNFDMAMDHALRAVFTQYGLEMNEEIAARYEAINRRCWLRLEAGELTKEQVTVGRFRTLFEEIGIADVRPEEINEAYQQALGSVFFLYGRGEGIGYRVKRKRLPTVCGDEWS